jgi:hypothetical protein
MKWYKLDYRTQAYQIDETGVIVRCHPAGVLFIPGVRVEPLYAMTIMQDPEDPTKQIEQERLTGHFKLVKDPFKSEAKEKLTNIIDKFAPVLDKLLDYAIDNIDSIIEGANMQRAWEEQQKDASTGFTEKPIQNQPDAPIFTGERKKAAAKPTTK